MRGTNILRMACAGGLLLSGGAFAQDCDRQCLEELVDRYLDAVIDNDPDAVPLSDEVRFTEDAQRLLIGDGLWNTMKSRGNYRIVVPDVAAGQVAFLGTITEDHREPEQHTPAMLALRLRLEDGEITEVEHLVVRNAESAARMDVKQPAPEFFEAVPADERMSREELIRVANSYFSGMEKNDGQDDYLFTEDCDRYENATKTANAPLPAWESAPDPATSTSYSINWSCKEQFESGLLFFVNRIRDRRFVAVDEERGVVYSFVFFDHSGGEHRQGRTPDGREVSAGPVQPWTWQIAELFKIEDGLISEIDAILQRAPYGMNSGWSSWEQGMSSEIQDVTFSED